MKKQRTFPKAFLSAPTPFASSFAAIAAESSDRRIPELDPGVDLNRGSGPAEMKTEEKKMPNECELVTVLFKYIPLFNRLIR